GRLGYEVISRSLRGERPFMRLAVFACPLFFVGVAFAARALDAQTPPQPSAIAPPMSRALSSSSEGPPLSLTDAVRLARESNADLAAARSDVEPLRIRPAQAHILAPPTLQAQVWQWPINTL